MLVQQGPAAHDMSEDICFGVHVVHHSLLMLVEVMGGKANEPSFF